MSVDALALRPDELFNTAAFRQALEGLKRDERYRPQFKRVREGLVGKSQEISLGKEKKFTGLMLLLAILLISVSPVLARDPSPDEDETGSRSDLMMDEAAATFVANAMLPNGGQDWDFAFGELEDLMSGEDNDLDPLLQELLPPEFDIEAGDFIEPFNSVNLRPEPTTDSANFGQLLNGSQVEVLDVVVGQNVNGNPIWLQIAPQNSDGEPVTSAPSGTDLFVWAGAVHKVEGVTQDTEPTDGGDGGPDPDEEIGAAVPPAQMESETENTPVPTSTENAPQIPTGGAPGFPTPTLEPTLDPNIQPTMAPTATTEPTSAPTITPVVPNEQNLIPQPQGTEVAVNQPVTLDSVDSLFNLEGLSPAKLEAINTIELSSLTSAEVRLLRSLDVASMTDDQVDFAIDTILEAPNEVLTKTDLRFNPVSNSIEWTENGETFRWRDGMSKRPDTDGHFGVRESSVFGSTAEGYQAFELHFEYDGYTPYPGGIKPMEFLTRPEYSYIVTDVMEQLVPYFPNATARINHVYFHTTGRGNDVQLPEQPRDADGQLFLSHKLVGDTLYISFRADMSNGDGDVVGWSNRALLSLMFALDAVETGSDSYRADTTEVGGIGIGNLIQTLKEWIRNEATQVATNLGENPDGFIRAWTDTYFQPGLTPELQARVDEALANAGQ